MKQSPVLKFLVAVAGVLAFAATLAAFAGASAPSTQAQNAAPPADATSTAAVAEPTVMDGVAAISEGASVSLRWSLPDEVFPSGGFVVTRTGIGGERTSWVTPSPLPPDQVAVDPETYQAASALFDPANAGAVDEGLALLRGFFTLQIAVDPDLAHALGLLFHDDDVVIGERYDYVVATAEGRLVGSASITAGSTPPLSAPTGLTATPTAVGVELIWDRGDEHDLVFAYRIEAGVNGQEGADLTGEWFAPPAPEVDDGPGQVVEAPYWFRDEGRTVGDTVAYEIVGRDLFGRTTPPSRPVVVTIPDPTPLPQPLVVEAESGDRVITLTWAVEPDERVAAVAVYRSSDIDVPPTLVSPLLPPQTTTWTDTGALAGPGAGLVGGVDYHYAVAALDAFGSGVVGPLWTQRAVNPHGPDAATGVSIEAAEGALLLSWTAPPQNDVGRYQVYAGRPGTPFAEMTMIGETALTSFSAPIPENTLFDVAYRVRAVNTSDVAGAVSAEVSGRPLDRTPPSAPLWADAAGVENAVELSWLRDLDPDIDHLRLSRTAADGGTAVVLAARLEPSVTAFRDEDVIAGVTYTYSLVAIDAQGNESEPSTGLAAIAWDLSPAPPVTGLGATPVADGVRLTWDAASSGETFLVTKAMGGAWVEISDLLNEASYLDPRGQVGDSYRVVSYSSSGRPGPATEATATE